MAEHCPASRKGGDTRTAVVSSEPSLFHVEHSRPLPLLLSLGRSTWNIRDPTDPVAYNRREQSPLDATVLLPSDSMPRILCLGMSALDAIYRVPAIPSTPTKILATGFAECGGGMAANASVAVARLGGQARYWGRVGGDDLGTRILDQLTAEGVDVTGVRRIPGCVSPSAAILVDAQGERLVCAYNDPNLDTDPSWLPLEQIADCHALLADVRWPAGAAVAFDAAARHGLITVFDGDVGPPEALLDLARRATHAIFSQLGLAQASGTSNPGEGLMAIERQVPGVVGVTLGPDGFLWREGARERRIPAPKVVAIDTLAAGDVWHGAFALALAEGRDVANSGRFANAAAAIKCSRAGGRLGTPRRHEVMALLSVKW